MAWEAEIIMDLARQAGLAVTDTHRNCLCLKTGHFEIHAKSRTYVVNMVEDEVTVRFALGADDNDFNLSITCCTVNLCDPDSIEKLTKHFDWLAHE